MACAGGGRPRLGVQEDDDFRFDWKPARDDAAPRVDEAIDVAVDGTPMSAFEVEDVPADPVRLERPEDLTIRRPRH